jgi:hypothetical protein
MKTLLYLTGPYSGWSKVKDEREKEITNNIAAAKMVAASLWELGYAVLCPHANTANFEKLCKASYDDYMEGDLEMVRTVDAVVAMPKWDISKGSKLEIEFARKLGIPVYFYPELPPLTLCNQRPGPSSSCLQKAEEIVHGSRQKDYGHPSLDFKRNAYMWTGILRDLLKPDVKLIPMERVALMMVAVKISRLIQTPFHPDSMVDGPGYFACYEMCKDVEPE